MNSDNMKNDGYAGKDKYTGRGLDVFGLKDLLLETINKQKGDENLNLLEIGCGKGNALLNLSSLYPKIKLTGINKNSTHGLIDQNELRQKASHLHLNSKNLTFQLADATKLPFDSNSFDIVISHVTFLHIENKAKALEETYRVLRPLGTAIISLGGYSILRKLGHPMPNFYKAIRRNIGTDFNPRFLIKTGSRNISLSNYFAMLHSDYDIELKAIKFISESQRGIAHWLVMRKKTNETLNLNLKYLPDESRKLTEFYSHNNPVNWGAIDEYELIKNQ